MINLLSGFCAIYALKIDIILIIDIWQFLKPGMVRSNDGQYTIHGLQTLEHSFSLKH